MQMKLPVLIAEPIFDPINVIEFPMDQFGRCLYALFHHVGQHFSLFIFNLEPMQQVMDCKSKGNFVGR